MNKKLKTEPLYQVQEPILGPNLELAPPTANQEGIFDVTSFPWATKQYEPELEYTNVGVNFDGINVLIERHNKEHPGCTLPFLQGGVPFNSNAPSLDYAAGAYDQGFPNRRSPGDVKVFSDETPRIRVKETGNTVSASDFEHEMTIEWTEEDEALIREARHLNPERIAFLESLGYSVEDWEAAFAAENRGRCEPFLHGGPYVMVRGFYTFCHGTKHEKDPTQYIEVHHTPAKRSMKNAGMNLKVWEDAGPSVAITRADHKETASYGFFDSAKEFTDRQSQLILNGQFGKAVEKDLNDLRKKFGAKYEVGIKQMEVYLGILESFNVVQ